MIRRFCDICRAEVKEPFDIDHMGEVYRFEVFFHDVVSDDIEPADICAGCLRHAAQYLAFPERNSDAPTTH